MSARVFLDTNVVAYAFDPAAPAKRLRARGIMDGGDWEVSWQVLPLKVAKELQQVIDEWERLFETSQRALPPVRVRPTLGIV